MSNAKHTEEFAELKVAEVQPTPLNPRVINMKSPKFLELLASVKKDGVRIRVAARPLPFIQTAGGMRYELLAGERRLMAAKAAGLETIPAIVHTGLTDQEAFELTFVENFAREDLTPLEESKAVEILLRQYSGDVKAVGSKLGISPKAVHLRMRLQKLTKEWQAATLDPDHVAFRLTNGHLELVARLPDATQNELLKSADHYDSVFVRGQDHLCSVQEVDKAIGAHLHVLSKAIWPADECKGCHKRTDAAAVLPLWEEDAGADPTARCLDTSCWKKKAEAAILKKAAEFKADAAKGLLMTETSSYDREGKVQRKKFAGVVETHHLADAKERAPGAVPCLMVDGPKIGEIVWKKKHPTYSDQSGHSKPATPAKALTVAEKRDQLDRTRWKAALSIVRSEIEKHDGKLLSEDQVLALATTFGTDNVSCDWSDYPKALKKGHKALVEELWHETRGVMTHNLWWHMAGIETPREMIKEAIGICELLKIDWKAIYEEIAKQPKFVEPPSWSKEEKKPKGKGSGKTVEKAAAGKTKANAAA